MTTALLGRRNRLASVAPAIGLAFLVAAPPVLLALIAGWPLPAPAEVAEAIRLRWVSTHLALHLGATVAWLCWLYLLVSVTVEIVAQLRRRTNRLLLPGMLARLVNAGVAVAVASSGLAIRQTAVPTRVPIVATVPLAASSPVAQPAPAPTYEVKPRDTLWDIAADRLGDPLRWRELWRLNAQQVMASGERFTEPGLIRPGWRLTLPATAQTRPPMPAERQQPAPAHVAAPSAEAAPVCLAPAVAPPATAPPATAPSAAPTAGRRPPPADGQDDSTRALPIGLGLGAAAVGIALALDQRRRRAMRRRPVGRRIALPTGDLAAAEQALRNPTIADRARLVGGAARLAALLVEQDGETTLQTVLEGPAGVELVFAGDSVSLRSPFLRTERGWLLPTQEKAATYAAADQADPAPALVHVGSVGDAAAYVNLEGFGVLAFEGNETDMHSLLTRIATGLGGAPWSDLVEVRIANEVTGCQDLTERGTRINLANEAERLSALSEHTARAVHAAGVSSLAALRLRTGEPPDGVSVVIADPGSPNIKSLIDLARDAATPVVLLIAGPYDGVDTIRLSGDSVEVPGLHRPVAADPLPTTTTEVVQVLLAQTDASAVTVDEAPYAEVRQQSRPAKRDADVEIALLGQVELRGVDLMPAFRDVVLYLALHRAGVETEKLATTLWPDKEPDQVNKTLRNRLYEARRALGGRISTAPRVRLDDSVETDWGRFQSLATGGLEEKVEALALIRGRPLDGINAEWVSDEGFVYEMEAAIVDLALEVGQALLDGDDPTGSLSAARAGLRSCPWDERLYRIAMRAAAARRSVGELKNLYKELRVALDLDVEDTIDPETELLYQQLLDDACRPVEA